MLLEFFVLMTMVFFGTFACIVVITAFAIGMGWLPGVNFDIAKIAIKDIYDEIKKGIFFNE